jgi:hypothetical protein
VLAVADVASRARSANIRWARLDADGWPILPPTLVTIHRTSDADEQSRQIVSALDGRRAGELLYGQTLTIEVPPGPHVLRVHNTLVWKTLKLDIEPGAHEHFTVWNRGTTLYYLMCAFLGAGPLLLGLAPGRPPLVPTGGRSRPAVPSVTPPVRDLDVAAPNAADS